MSDRNEISDAVRDTVRDAAASYGVEIRRADVKDLVFPGNLREIMNQVLETERRGEAKLIDARREAEAMRIKTAAEAEARLKSLETEAEATRIKTAADNEARIKQLETEREANRLRAENECESNRMRTENERELAKIRLSAEVEQAKALQENPELLKLRQIEALRAMAESGGRFVMGLDSKDLPNALSDD